MRLRDYSDTVPKPMVTVGYRPLLWHVMKYYAHFGHKDFLLCLGYRGDAIKNYFLHYEEAVSNDFIFTAGGKDIQLLNSDIGDWRITFVDTGVSTSVGQRLRAVEPYLRDEPGFLANYSDGLTDLDLTSYLEDVIARDTIANFVCVRPTPTFHVVSVGPKGLVDNIEAVNSSDVWINGGYFYFKRDIFNYIDAGDDLVMEPFERLIARHQLYAYKFTGFWTAVDTFKDRERIETMYSRGEAPWELWRAAPKPPGTAPPEFWLAPPGSMETPASEINSSI
jgi:glucose-1-phosphate cytidylyltransferase